MENSIAIKIQRSTRLIKTFMMLVVIVQCIQYFQTSVFDFGALAGAGGILSLLRGLLVSPILLVTPMKKWFTPTSRISKESCHYFLLAFVSIIASSF